MLLFTNSEFTAGPVVVRFFYVWILEYIMNDSVQKCPCLTAEEENELASCLRLPCPERLPKTIDALTKIVNAMCGCGGGDGR